MIREAIRAERSIMERCVHIYMQRFDLYQRVMFVPKPLVYEKHEPGSATGPAIRLQDEQAQELMDDLWRAGFRPAEVGTAGQLAATERHLKDLQELVEQVLPRALRK